FGGGRLHFLDEGIVERGHALFIRTVNRGDEQLVRMRAVLADVRHRRHISRWREAGEMALTGRDLFHVRRRRSGGAKQMIAAADAGGKEHESAIGTPPRWTRNQVPILRQMLWRPSFGREERD